MGALDDARAALSRADHDPARAGAAARAAIRDARREHDPAALSVAERALGRSLLQTGDVAAAIRHLRRAAAAERADLAGEARIPLAAALVQRGRSREALREIDAAVAALDGAGRARALAQRADVLHQIGHLDRALAGYQAAVPLLRRAGDLLNLQRTLVNRGILHTERHAFAAAEADLLAADALARRLGRPLAVGIIAENLGFLATLRGDVPAALAHLAVAEQTIGAHGGQLGPVYQDRAELLLSTGVVAEARADAARAIAAFEAERRGSLVPPARLLLAQAAFLAGDWAAARAEADRAREGFTRQRRPQWAAAARLVAIRARLCAGEAGVRVPPGLVDALAAAGWPAAVVEARLAAATVALRRGRPATAELAAVAAVRSRGPALLRARGWYAEALRRRAVGHPKGAAAAVRAGLRILDEHAAALGATDLRVHSAAHRTELTDLGTRIALAGGRPAAVFEWAERGRASRLAHRPVSPPADPELADLLGALRALAREPGRGQLALERRIRDAYRTRAAGEPRRSSRPATPSELRTALGDRALVEYLRVDGELLAITLVDGRLGVHRLGGGPGDLVDRVAFALHRMARRTAGTAAARALLADSAAKLDRLLLGGLPHTAGRPLVVVPTGALHGLPWSVLPSCAGRPVTVAPSATLWLAAGPPRPPRSVAVAAGPGLSRADAEARAVAAIHGCAPLLGPAATATAVTAAMGSADLLHLAAHGRIAVDNPLFSSLHLHDGPLMVYDLEHAPAVPRIVVLAACATARPVVCAGDELLGLSAAFIGRGTTTLIAPVIPIPDAETVPLMTALHHHLAAGHPPATALAEAQRTLTTTPGPATAAATAFVCLGAG
ncbi:CHAT domain-containing protein [Actinokineospora sp. NPDC004072]